MPRELRPSDVSAGARIVTDGRFDVQKGRGAAKDQPILAGGQGCDRHLSIFTYGTGRTILKCLE